MAEEVNAVQIAVSAFFESVYAGTSRRLKKLQDAKRKLAHYTTAANAINIIGGKTLWLRNSAVMNDFSELSYGRQLLHASMDEIQEFSKPMLSKSHEGLWEEVLAQLADRSYTVQTQTNLTSLAEHDADDELGKLSMWRAYGGPVAGVALVMNTDVLDSDSDALAAFTHPVKYGPLQFRELFHDLFASLWDHQKSLEEVPRENAKSIPYNFLQDVILTTKHLGFAEEEEWRVIHNPYLNPSSYVHHKVAVIGDLPQVVYQLRLEDQPGLNLPELEVSKLLHRVIIGPCQYPRMVADAIRQALENVGVENAHGLIRISDIPLRQRN